MGHTFLQQITNGKASWNQAGLGDGRRENVHPSCELAIESMPPLSKWKSEDERNKNSVSAFVNWFTWCYFGPWVRTKRIFFFFRNSDIFQQKGKMEWKQVAIPRKMIRRCWSLLPYMTFQYQTYLLIVLISIRIIMTSLAIMVSYTLFPFYTMIFHQRKLCFIFEFSEPGVITHAPSTLAS